MKHFLWLALLPAFCLCGQSALLCAQNAPGQAARGKISGVLKDPNGAAVRRARIQVRNAATGAAVTHSSDAAGHFVFDHLAAGSYKLEAAVLGFAVIHRDLEVASGGTTQIELTLHLAAALAEVHVYGNELGAARRVSASERARSRNVAELAASEPGVSLRSGGELSSVPVLRGLGEERANIVVNGARVTSSCPNYMNDPLSYASAASAATVRVLAGITPVSSGGDSLAGTIAIDSNPPAFAETPRLLTGANLSTFYRSNGESYGGALHAFAALRNLSASYTGTWARNENYTDGSGHKITSTYAQSTDHVVTFAAQDKGTFVELEAGVHNTPYEGFANAQMDSVRNWAESLNLHLRRALGAGALDARAYWQGEWHSMNVGRDKIAFTYAMWMPMNTHGRDFGYSLEYEGTLNQVHTLRVGNELHRFRLDDTWPPVAGASMMMSPNTFINIHNGRRTRLGTYVELSSRWSETFGTVFGLRNDTVWTDADAVSGYSSMYATDAAAFNAARRTHTDALLDITAQAHWDATPLLALEIGYARKNRAPNLYERYAWSKMWMAALMIGWFGDGNAYVGNTALRPESAHTVSGALRLRGRNAHVWEIKAAPYVNLLHDFIDVSRLGTKSYAAATVAKLQFTNTDARIVGGDLAGNFTLWDNLSIGSGALTGSASWLHGERTGDATPLYQMMPMHARLNFDEEWRTFTAGLGAELIGKKHDVDPLRFEQRTPGYALLHFRAGYKNDFLDAGFSAENLLNKCYELPLGGVNLDDFLASGRTAALKPLTGRGRSFSLHLSMRLDGLGGKK